MDPVRLVPGFQVIVLRYTGYTIVLFVLACGCLTIGAFLNGLLA